MLLTKQCQIVVLLLLAIPASWQNTAAQTTEAALPESSPQLHAASATSSSASLTDAPADVSRLTSSPQLLLDFKDSDIKFSLQTLMDTLRDTRHEGWVLAAYPDPKTSRPLIGAGFGLDVPATEHPQLDPLNPHPFIEPSSAQLWQAAGLDSDQLQTILDRFNRDLNAWKKKKYRRKIRMHTLTPELTNVEATRLLRISSIQAVQNARAYCRDFDQLTGPQQMALSQLVFQMGVNLEEFVQFLSAINDSTLQTAEPPATIAPEDAHWKTVQRTLIESQWAHQYTSRATSVIAMFDPEYLDDPPAAERRVAAELPPPVRHHRRKAHSSQSKRKLA
ncbi:hypothetical protein H7849_26350 [Alloacidobacterium dinghuense]|uniref:Uncharacterized protein n=1 Tax=Alloacidobacterium dinghuense TaxID=2763107 RepID=A0A7G8BIS7_9BACT|nr:hypothetical protein [Alloacidobacterium dinghuense]QNI32447.1 hypothetical protein H7849_26350 [Alloacidobacterium dinghuense]